MTIKAKQEKKKGFSHFRYTEAFKLLRIDELQKWHIEIHSCPPSDFLKLRLQRLEQCFDLQNYEESKKLVIDAICEEAIITFEYLKIWKGAALSSNVATGAADYLIAERKAYLEAPFLCIVEAKKDDFEQGLAQCLVEMQACQWRNTQIGKRIDVFGIVTNGDTWKAYKLVIAGAVYETMPHATGDLDRVLGLLQAIFQECQQNLLRLRGYSGMVYNQT